MSSDDISAAPPEQIGLPIEIGQHVESDGGPGRILLGVFETLDRAGVRYCVLHGYETYPQQIKSDVDCVIDRNITPAELYALLHRGRARIGADIVHCRGYYFVLAGKNPDGSQCFLALDMTVDCEFNDLPFHAGTEVIESRRRYRQFWIPAAGVEFGCYLARTIAKEALDDSRARRLSSLYRQDPAACRQHVRRFWRSGGSELILSAARSGDWDEVRLRLGSFRAELRRRATLLHPGRFAGNKLRSFLARMRRVRHPDGLNVVLLGPDGAGKSSVIEALRPRLSGAFARFACWGFAPPLHRLLRRRQQPTDQPHALPPRSLPTSMVRAGYWFTYSIAGYLILRLALARATLVLNDRHFVDILVDARRYRYGGPRWLLRLIWRLIPKPDLIILLDAPAEVLQARKQEVSLEETARQRRAYLSLVRTLENGHVVDASRSLEHVASDVSDVILRHLATRVARRLGFEQNVAESPSIGNETLPIAKE
jgi:thymidylate kinase